MWSPITWKASEIPIIAIFLVSDFVQVYGELKQHSSDCEVDYANNY